MKKKLMMVAAVVGLLSLNACVDDAVSPSVEAVRNAKAEQLKAVAAYYNAQAEAELIMANAEKAMIEANAAYRANETEEAKQKFAIELEAIKAEAQARLLVAQLAIANAEKNLLGVENDKINELFTTYKDEVAILQGFNQDLLTENLNLKKLQADLVTAKNYVAQQKVALNNTIKIEEAKLAALSKLGDNTKQELLAEIEDLEIQKYPLDQQLTKLSDDFDKADDTFDAAKNNLSLYPNPQLPGFNSSLKLVEAAKELNSNYWGIINTENVELAENGNVSYDVDKYSLVRSQVTLITNQLTIAKVQAVEDLGKASTQTTPATGVYIQYENLKAAQKTANDNYTADPSEPNRRAKAYADAAVQTYEDGTLADALQDVTDKDNDLKDFNALVESFAGADLTAYNEAIDALKKDAEAAVKADDAIQPVQDQVDAIDAQIATATTLESGMRDLPQLKADAQKAIDDAKQSIVALETIDPDGEGAVDVLVKYSEEKIKVIEAKIVAQTALVSKAKAALDAAIAE